MDIQEQNKQLNNTLAFMLRHQMLLQLSMENQTRLTKKLLLAHRAKKMVKKFLAKKKTLAALRAIQFMQDAINARLNNNGMGLFQYKDLVKSSHAPDETGDKYRMTK